ncbi:efflux RND transporter periplasmic adaptor subunit [Pseudoduganella umbonata]|uniref:Efflux RND transporter periplasmic adaptor subunit n=1 Tax=Pseudoduganella umbonata TaxID=864828 RepID=A0A4P8HRI1_9BURK|nr:efflux RND transporter periplasmic adaptor subunit [Pseudoduganella umbonata]MBB3224420.1 membrane fusion protein (multidrug efflux system) [Pseudoduganella umbonata]QCP11222.1 efflux RND transporter periplasmic adaptor subunit [Pseudoduganella umbonata]
MNNTLSRPPLRSAGILFLACAAALTAGCDSDKQQQAGAPGGKMPPPQVAVYTVKQEALPVVTELPGRTSAFQIAEVRPQVAGIVQKRLFTEGADVKAGTQLYQIDPATYQATFSAAKAALARAEANLLTAGPKVKRYKELVEIEGVSRQDYDDAVAAEAQARADVESARAQLQTARINVGYTKVQAPISGRIGRSNVTAGALVTAGQETALTTVQQLDPIYVDVTQSSEDLLRLKKSLEGGGVKKAEGKVTLRLADGSTYAQAGKLQFADVAVDPGTGNVTLRALFPNPKHDLLPGMFVRAVVENGVNEQAIAVPQQGVTRNQKGEATALVLNQQGIVEQRVIATTGTLGDRWLVKSGLAAGDRVIVEGIQKVKPGAPAVVAAPAAPAAASTAAAKPAAAAAH